MNYPVILGHEFSGRVAKVGSLVKNFKEGDRVVSETAAVINPDSPLARVGRYNLDPSRKGFGYGVDRCHDHACEGTCTLLASCAQGSAANDRCAYRALLCGIQRLWLATSMFCRGDRILVLGPGPIGLLWRDCQAARAEVAVAGIARDAVRLKTGRTLGCEAIDVSKAAEWAKARDGLGCEGFVDAAGISATLRVAIDVVRPAGWISKVGWGRAPVDFSLDPIVQKNVTLQAVSRTPGRFGNGYGTLASGALDVNKIVGGRWTLDQWETAFRNHALRIHRQSSAGCERVDLRAFADAKADYRLWQHGWRVDRASDDGPTSIARAPCEWLLPNAGLYHLSRSDRRQVFTD